MVYAHRGASAYAPENTVSAFKKALDLKADGIEIDIHLTKDNEIVVTHDGVLGRTSNLRGPVNKLTLMQLKEGDFGGWFSDEFADERIPTLEETLKLLDQTGVILNIEIKKNFYTNKGIEEKMIELIHKYDFERQVIISSFNHYSLMTVKKIDERIKTAVLYSEQMYNPWEYAVIAKADAIHPFYESITEEAVDRCLKNNIMVNPYTVDNPEHIAKLAKWNVSGVITNYPDTALDIISGRDNY